MVYFERLANAIFVSTETTNLTNLEIEQFRITLGKHIRKLRNIKGMGQEEFADYAGIHRNHVGLVELGKIDLRLSSLQRIAAACHIPLNQLFEISTD